MFIIIGCGFCDKAKAMLDERRQDITFTQETVIATDTEIRRALGNLLKLGDVTYPQIVIRGVYIGGSDNLQDIIRVGKFDDLVRAPKYVANRERPIRWYEPLEIESQTPKLFESPSRKSSWYCFQLYMYSNLIRYISLLQILVLIICLTLISTNNNNHEYIICKIILSLTCIDLLILVLHGNAPFSITGTLATYFGWRSRGNITSSLPYKFIFIIYLSVLIPIIVSLKSSGHDSHDNTGGIASMTSLLINSTLLVVFRF